MAGPGFTQTFGGSALYPAQSTYSNVALTQSIQLLWPTELSIAGAPIVADIMDVTASVGGLTISFSDATNASTGYTALFNNIGANTFTVLDAAGGVIAAITSGTAWLIYLADNSTVAGTWRIFQMGAGTSSANAAALAGAGLKAITTTLNEFVTVKTENANYVSTIGDRAEALEWTGGVGSFTLPDAAVVGTGWFCYIKNSGTGTLTVSPIGGQFLDGQASVAYSLNNSSIVVCDGANFFTIGYGQAINSVFNFISINLTGVASPLVLSGAQLNRISYQFTGVLTTNMVIRVPATVQQYWVDNETTGAFTLTLQSPTPGTTTAVTQGQRNILYCDGVNVVAAVTFGATGFTNGSVGAPSIFFAASPHTGFYSPGADQIALSTLSTQRILVDSAGHVTVNGADDTAPSFTVFGPTGGFGRSMLISTPIGGSASFPNLQLLTTAVGGFATLSICAQGASAGVGDVALFQAGTSLNGTLINRNSGSTLAMQTTGTGQISLAPGGTGVLICSPPGTNAVVMGSNNVNSIGFLNLTQSVATAGGASALPATPAGYLTVTVNGGTAKIPYYAT